MSEFGKPGLSSYYREGWLRIRRVHRFRVRPYRMVHAVLRDLILSPDPGTLPGDPADFVFGVRLLTRHAGGPAEESFGLTVCTLTLWRIPVTVKLIHQYPAAEAANACCSFSGCFTGARGSGRR